MPVKLDYTWLIVYFVKFDGDTIVEAIYDVWKFLYLIHLSRCINQLVGSANRL